VFAAALHINQSDSEFLRDRLLEAALTGEAVLDKRDEFGQRYILDFECVMGVRHARVRSAWIVLAGENFPRLTTCFVLADRGTECLSLNYYPWSRSLRTLRKRATARAGRYGS
jgi:hypothetical protein